MLEAKLPEELFVALGLEKSFLRRSMSSVYASNVCFPAHLMTGRRPSCPSC